MMKNSPHRLTITISRDGSLFVNGEPQSEETVFERVAELQRTAAKAEMEPEVRIRPDRLGQHGPFRRLYEHCAQHNIRQIQFAVSAEGQL